MSWSNEDYASYTRDGFLFKRQLIDPIELQALHQDLSLLMDGDEADDGMHREREHSGAVRQIYAAHVHNACFQSLARNPDIIQPVQRVLDDDLYIWHSKINVKDAFEGTVWLWHQDYGYWQHDGVRPRMISVMVLLDEATINNGCLMGIAGSHKWGTLPHAADTVTTSYRQWCITQDALRQRINERDIRHFTGAAGDVLFFDCNLVHGSGHNMSPLPRKTFIIGYNSISNIPHAVAKPRPDWVVDRRHEVIS